MNYKALNIIVVIAISTMLTSCASVKNSIQPEHAGASYVRPHYNEIVLYPTAESDKELDVLVWKLADRIKSSGKARNAFVADTSRFSLNDIINICASQTNTMVLAVQYSNEWIYDKNASAKSILSGLFIIPTFFVWYNNTCDYRFVGYKYEDGQKHAIQASARWLSSRQIFSDNQSMSEYKDMLERLHSSLFNDIISKL